MEKMQFQRDYLGSLTEELSNSTVGEIQINLSQEPISNKGFLLIDKGTTEEETIFFHRRVGTVAFAYGVNRSNPNTHPVGTKLFLVSSVEAMNYLADVSFEHFYIYKKDNQQVIIEGGRIYAGSDIEVESIDTSAGNTDQVLIPGAINYVYLQDAVIKISSTKVATKYPIGEITVAANGDIEDINMVKVFVIEGEKGKTGIDQKGTYAPTTAYVLNDVVQYEGSSYICIAPTTGNLPTDTSKWTLIVSKGDRGTSVTGVSKTATNGLVDTYTMTFSDSPDFVYFVTNGEKGDKGDQGIQGIQGIQGERGTQVQSVTKTGTVGLVDTYTVLMSDGGTSTFTVTNGEKGDKGDQGIQGIQGLKGDTGDTGDGISTIAKTATEGITDTYTVTMTSGATYTFTVTNASAPEYLSTKYVAGEDLLVGVPVSLIDKSYNISKATDGIHLNKTNETKLAFPIFLNKKELSELRVGISHEEGMNQTLDFRIETDNGNEPSGTLVASGATASYNAGATISQERIRYLRESNSGSSGNGNPYFCEIQAIERGTGTNIALNKGVTLDGGTGYPFGQTNNYFTDGNTTNYAIVETTGIGTATVDLGGLYDIETIIGFHYGSGWTYYDVKYEVSVDGVNWIDITSQMTITNTNKYDVSNPTGLPVVDLAPESLFGEKILPLTSTILVPDNSWYWLVIDRSGTTFSYPYIYSTDDNLNSLGGRAKRWNGASWETETPLTEQTENTGTDYYSTTSSTLTVDIVAKVPMILGDITSVTTNGHTTVELWENGEALNPQLTATLSSTTRATGAWNKRLNPGTTYQLRFYGGNKGRSRNFTTIDNDYINVSTTLSEYNRPVMNSIKYIPYDVVENGDKELYIGDNSIFTSVVNQSKISDISTHDTIKGITVGSALQYEEVDVAFSGIVPKNPDLSDGKVYLNESYLDIPENPAGLVEQLDGVVNYPPDSWLNMLGRDTGRQKMGQSFTVTSAGNFLQFFSVYIGLIGNPSADLTAELFDESDDSLVMTSPTVIQRGDISEGVEAKFMFNKLLEIGKTYRFVISTTQNNTGNYYRVYAINTNPYSGGIMYANTALSPRTEGDLKFRLGITTTRVIQLSNTSGNPIIQIGVNSGDNMKLGTEVESIGNNLDTVTMINTSTNTWQYSPAYLCEKDSLVNFISLHFTTNATAYQKVQISEDNETWIDVYQKRIDNSFNGEGNIALIAKAGSYVRLGCNTSNSSYYKTAKLLIQS